jgi:hypothetical protein
MVLRDPDYSQQLVIYVTVGIALIAIFIYYAYSG